MNSCPPLWSAELSVGMLGKLQRPAGTTGKQPFLNLLVCESSLFWCVGEKPEVATPHSFLVWWVRSHQRSFNKKKSTSVYFFPHFRTASCALTLPVAHMSEHWAPGSDSLHQHQLTLWGHTALSGANLPHRSVTIAAIVSRFPHRDSLAASLLR